MKFDVECPDCGCQFIDKEITVFACCPNCRRWVPKKELKKLPNIIDVVKELMKCYEPREKEKLKNTEKLMQGVHPALQPIKNLGKKELQPK